MAEASQVQTNHVICNIILKDGSKIEVCDPKVLDACKVLENFFQIDADNEKTVDVTLEENENWDDKAIKFVFENAVKFVETDADFENSEHLALCDNLEVKDLLKIMEVSNYLDCKAVFKAVGYVAGQRLRLKRGIALTEALGYETDMSKEEQQQARQQAAWYLPPSCDWLSFMDF